MENETCGSFLHPLSTLEWTDCEESKPHFNLNYFGVVESIYIPDNQGGKLYIIADHGIDFKFCRPNRSPIKWHDLPPLINIPGLPSINFSGFTMAAFNSQLVVIGGMIWSLNPKRHTWDELPRMKNGRLFATAVEYGHHFIVAGGKMLCESREPVNDVEVYDGESRLWTQVKPLPEGLCGQLTSVIHSDKRIYVIVKTETNSQAPCEFRTTYSAPIEELISDSAAYQWQLHSPKSSPPPGKLPLISFDGQLLAIGCNDGYRVATLCFYSQEKESWVSIESIPFIEQYCKVIAFAGMSDRRELLLIYCPSGLILNKQHVIKKAIVHRAQQSQLDQHFSMSALTKLEYGHRPIRVLSQLQPLKLRQLKRKAIFNLKPLDDLTCGRNDAAVGIYIKCWLEDRNAGCCPTWRNLLVILSDIGLEDVAAEILKVILDANTPTITTAASNGMEEIVDLQVSLASLKDECVKLEREDQRKAIQPVIDSCLSACCEIAWTARHIKVETKMQTEQVHAEIKPLSDKLQAQEKERERKQQQRDLLEALTSDDCVRQMKSTLSQSISQCTQPEIKRHMGKCIELCNQMQKQFAKEKKQLMERIQTLEADKSGNENDESPQNKAEPGLGIDDLRDVQKAVWEARSKWYNLGLELGISPGTLDSIKATNQNPDDLFADMIKDWLRNGNPKPNWATIANALRSPTVGYGHIAEQVHGKA